MSIHTDGYLSEIGELVAAMSSVRDFTGASLRSVALAMVIELTREIKDDTVDDAVIAAVISELVAVVGEAREARAEAGRLWAERGVGADSN